MNARAEEPRREVVERVLRIDEWCDRFEDLWRAGRGPTVAEYMGSLGLDPTTSPPELVRELDRLVESYRAVGGTACASGTASGTGPGLAGTPVIDGYTIVGELGRGGMGVVYRAEDRALGRQVAIKVLKPELAADPVARARFLREARAAAAVQHDHVMPIFHVGETTAGTYIVMPVLAGESLESRLARAGALGPAEVVRIGREAAEGLTAAHARGLIHRDVKPANLWLEAPTDRVRLLDFGLARVTGGADGLTQSGVVFGTAAYMSPEQADGLELDGRADLFGLGAVLYRCATGRAAFAGKTLTAVLRAVADHQPPAPHVTNPAVPRRLSELIMRMLSKSPSGRPDSARAAADELAAAGGRTSPRPVRRETYLLLAVATVGLILVVCHTSNLG